jgi:hypothetical protein
MIFGKDKLHIRKSQNHFFSKNSVRLYDPPNDTAILEQKRSHEQEHQRVALMSMNRGDLNHQNK